VYSQLKPNGDLRIAADVTTVVVVVEEEDI
jgi:hypothetical protein